MINFKKLTHLPILDLENELNHLLLTNIISWDPTGQNQISITTSKDHLDDYHYGTGSFIYDWQSSTINADGSIFCPKFKTPKREEEFTELCLQFNNTVFEELYYKLKEHYLIGRIRLIRSKPKTCMTWHFDDTPRLHYPIKTQEGCLMIIENEVKHLDQHSWWWTDTRKFHTAINASKEERLHLVVTVINEI